jgi:hypothetical protein
MRGSGIARRIARTSLEELNEALERAALATDLEHRADDDADHVAHEGVGGYAEAEDVSLPPP